MHSSTPLQFVITKTFLGMLDTVSKTFIVTSNEEQANSDQVEEYETMELEEETLIEKFQSKINKKMDDQSQVDEVEEVDNEANEENPSFNFLIKNELGFDVSLNALSGFKFQNLDLIDPEKQKDFNIDRIVLKNNRYCPISLEADFMGSFKSSIRALEEPERQRTSMKFKLEVTLHTHTLDLKKIFCLSTFKQIKKIIDGNWQPTVIAMGHSDLNGFYLNRKKQSEEDINTETLIICQTVTKLDKRRLYLRSPVQVNTLKSNIVTLHYNYNCFYLVLKDYKHSGHEYRSKLSNSNTFKFKRLLVFNDKLARDCLKAWSKMVTSN